MILITDTQYEDTSATTSGIILANWHDLQPQKSLVYHTTNVAEYVPGQFYKRELPCILGLLRGYNLKPDYILIDGHAYLDGSSVMGLGAHLFEALGGRSKIIGVAKSRFKDMPEKYALYRGQSQTPLWVTTAGMDTEIAKQNIAAMSGEHRLPAMIRRADQLARGN